MVVLAAGAWFAYELFDNRRFDAERWKTAGGCVAGSPRGAMMRDLTHDHLAVGMTQSHVFRILGKPDKINYPLATSSRARPHPMELRLPRVR